MKIITVNNYEDFYSDFPVSQDILPPLTEKDFNLSGLDSKIKNRLFQLLISHKSAFARSTVELSAAATEHHRISLQHDYPIKCPIYKIPFNLRNEFRRQIADLEKAGIISKSNSQYNTPALFVKQKEKWRLVLDFRKLNKITLTQDFVIPTLDAILHEISGSNYFSAVDMKSAFNQIPLHFADRHKTAFSTPDGDKYEFNRLCFGLKNSPKAFQSIAQEVLGDLLHNGALIYIDDIILFTKIIDEHFELLGKVFERFERIHLKFNPSKCQFLTKSCKFLGFVVTPEGILIDKDKSVSINEFPIPTDQKQIKSFLGCCNFYRRYIKNFAKRALPLTNLLRKDTLFEWTSETQEAFDDIKKAILNPPILALPNPNAELQITTDASSRGIGAVLEQKYPNSEVKPLYFFSKKLTPSQSKYNATVLEFFAIYTALNFFRPFLLGRKFKVFTDHKPLAGFLSNKNPSSKILRWKLALEEFNYDIHYIRGSLNSVADHLSRCINNITIALPDSKDLIKMQHEDPVLSHIIQKKLIKMTLAHKSATILLMGKVCYVICPSARPGHPEYGGHLKFFKTYHRLSENFFSQNMYKDTKNFVRSCTVCLSRKNAFKIPPAPHQPVEQSQEPGETCHIDIFGPLKTTPKDFVEFSRLMGIHKRHISSYSAHVNGRVEKPNQSLANILASITQNTNDWDEQLPHTMLALNSAIHEATYTSPFLLEHGRDIRLSYTYEKNSDTPQNKTSSHGCFRCIGSSCITRFAPSRVRSLDVPHCTMSRTPTRFKQHRVTTTRPMNCYAVSTRLGRSRHRFLFSPDRTWTAVRDQESVNQESNVWEKEAQSSRGLPSESSDLPTDDSSDEQVPANNLLEYLSDSEEDDEGIEQDLGCSSLYSENTAFPTSVRKTDFSLQFNDEDIIENIVFQTILNITQKHNSVRPVTVNPLGLARY
ncbi:retrovirus-related Pol polyprotein from transposon 17.6 [Trichonephila clavipes]|uniref:RNA-directed DNA polymerase n=1 Tax=Trichonephila clavipes TaxID=2585209 RepID=A0A8X6S6P8_TRICX|nr:retrovirus-related Pol polyprotein from transposon 17.6 [Trichonephila clavipes]